MVVDKAADCCACNSALTWVRIMSSSSVNESPAGSSWVSLVEEVGGRRGGARDVGPAVAVLAAVEDRSER